MAEAEKTQNTESKKTTIVATKGTFDWAFPPFIVASTAIAMGREVSIFCTFYGLNLLLKDTSKLRVTPLGNPGMPMKMPFGPKWLQDVDFGPKIPSIFWNIPGSEALVTSLMKKTMKKNGVATLDELRETCLEFGVKLVACEMTVGLFGYRKSDFIDGIEFAGAASYLEDVDGATHNLFI